MGIIQLFNDKKFFKSMLKLAIPIALQNLILSSLNLVDTIIIGGLGETAIASVGLANQYFFLLNLLLFGITSGSSIFTAQYWGNKDIKNIRRVLGLCLLTGCSAALLFTLGGLFFPKQILSIFSKDADVIMLGSQYLKIIVFSYVITSITFAYSFTLRSTGQVKIPMIVSVTALAINTILNYLLVYGYFGFPKMGTNGSATATLIARIIEMCLILFAVYRKNNVIAAKFSELMDLSKAFILNFFKVTIPVILNESIWALGVTMYAIVYARMGTEVIASTNISSTVERITWVIFMGLGNACAVMIGHKIGEGNEKDAFIYAKRFIILGPVFAMFAGILVFFTSPWILSAYKVSPVVYNYAAKNLIVFSIFLWVKVFNFTSIVGILRSGGDTTFCLILDTGGVWLIGVPLVFLGGLVWHLPVYYVYALVYMEEVAKLIIGLPRILSKKWINNLASKTVV
ncbi:MATE family efflux transporter [Clostridium sp. YIM B02515]|uniref:MATE family efflux transporter n=1 Tax=Clostridium rhizosphaerae TaxID=2803861 RepID=A0ABS1TDH0_9CLOT|nr:MATE family efflux transporter [Clostridium rhizosphaerae]MBL4937408.1 MATE family efflux transporter [Clostridium rhizosphaerae]